jgi:pimeloyl-ACP methyl ester carboxylesterase
MAHARGAIGSTSHTDIPAYIPLQPPTANVSGDSSNEDLAPFPAPEISTCTLESKPGAKLAYTYYAASASTPQRPNPFAKTQVVFLNGLMLPRASWEKTMQSFVEKRILNRLPYPSLLSYDRYGQGDSERDPDDKEPPPCHGHDCQSSVHDLRQFTLQIWKEHLDVSNPTESPALILVCNSIGCAIARLFAQTYPGTVLGLLFLDSIIANGDLGNIWPNPDAKDFDPRVLPEGVTEQDLRDARVKYGRVFGPDVPNAEGLSRRNLLDGYGGEGPYLTVCGHDWETFAEQGYTGSLHTPKVLTMTYANPYWQKYNEGLVKITNEGKGVGPIIAVGCGHFVQKDGPEFVADELVSLLDRVVNRVEQVSVSDGA